MTTGEKILFVFAIVLAVAALVFGVFCIYFGVSAQILKLAHEAEAGLGTGIGLGFTLVFMLLAFVASGGATLLSVALFAARPVRSQVLAVRRSARITVIALLVLLIVQSVLFVLGMM